MDARDVTSIPTMVLDQDDEPGPHTDLSDSKAGEIHFHAPESPNDKVWAQHNPPQEAEFVQTEEKDVYLDVSEVEATVSKPDHKITVRILRRILSIMMVILYKTDMEIANKRKMKSLWDRRPPDWPAHVPFKDPNNGVKQQDGTHGQKPVQKELMEMYKFLKHKYKTEVRILTTGKMPPEAAGISSIKEEPATPYVKEPLTPVTPKLEPVASLPQESAEPSERVTGPVALHEDRSYAAGMAEVPVEPQVIAPEGMEVRVEYVNAACPSPAAGRRLPDVLEELFERLARNYQEVQTIVDAYNPSAAHDFERMGKALEQLTDETRNDPEKFQLILNEVGHKVESFLTKVQLLSGNYVSNSTFPKECLELALEIEKRKKAALNIKPPSYQNQTTHFVGMVLNNTPTPAVIQTRQAYSSRPSTDHSMLAVVRHREAPSAIDDQSELTEPKTKIPRLAHATNVGGEITKQDLSAALREPLREPQNFEMSALDCCLDVMNMPGRKYVENQDNGTGCEEAKELPAPSKDEMMESVLELEAMFGRAGSPLSQSSAASTIQSPSTPRYFGLTEDDEDDAAVVSLHQSNRTVSPNNLPPAVVVSGFSPYSSHSALSPLSQRSVLSPLSPRYNFAGDNQETWAGFGGGDRQDDDDSSSSSSVIFVPDTENRGVRQEQGDGGGGDTFVRSPEANGVPTTVDSMEVDHEDHEDHEEDHFQLQHHGMVEEV